jgi:phage terminase Nu1 subunit (DNA packaging protein)
MKQTVKDTRRVGRAELAAMLGVSADHITRLIGDGLPCAVTGNGRGHKSEFDVVACVRWWRERLEADAAERVAQITASPDLEKARARKMKAEARIAELNAAEREGELVAVADVESSWSRRVFACRERLLVLPGVARQLAIVNDDGEEALDRLVREALNQLAGRDDEVKTT